MLKHEPHSEGKVNPERQEHIIHDVRFTHEVKKGKSYYKSSATDRKIIVLKSGSAPPEEGMVYDVRVVQDTNQGNPMEGIYYVEIMDEGVPIEDAGLTGEGDDLNREKSEIAGDAAIVVDKERKVVTVVDIEVPYVGKETPLVPGREEFVGFALDKKTLMQLRKLASAVSRRQPHLSEGGTATSKTSCINFLAMLTGNEVERLNMSGQSDTTELIGKFVPNDGELQIAFEELLKSEDSLSAESKAVLRRAREANRALTKVEAQKIAVVEGLKVSDWRWQHGYTPRAMVHGRWVIYDEGNLAEQQVLERLNSALEQNPSLALTEYDGRKIARNGDIELDKNFRAFFTMNPVEEFEGRKALTPAFRNRWTSQMMVESPTCTEYEQMILLMITGKQPDVEIDDIKYKGGQEMPVFPELSKLPWIKAFAASFASLHEDIEKLGRARGIGKNRKEKYVFTRRNIISVLQFMNEAVLVDRRTGKRVTVKEYPKRIISRALQETYLDLVLGSDDKTTIGDKMKINGFPLDGQWTWLPGKG